MIAIPQWIIDRKNVKELQQPETFFSMIYIQEITREATLRRRTNRIRRMPKTDEIVERKKDSNLFANCVWFTCRIFLRQCKYAQ
jgi:hypothetical protein